jgi:hypothetical protein
MLVLLTWEKTECFSVLLFFLPCEQFFWCLLSCLACQEIEHFSVVLFSLPFEQLGQAAGDHVREVLVVHRRVELAVRDRIPILLLGNVRRDEDVSGGLVAVKQVAGSCYNFWRRCCRYLPWRAAVCCWRRQTLFLNLLVGLSAAACCQLLAATNSVPQFVGRSVGCCCWFVCCPLKELLPACCCCNQQLCALV